jgi:hypothetical protein
MSSPADDDSRNVSSETTVSAAPPGSDNPAVPTEHPVVDSTAAPTTVDVTSETTTMVLALNECTSVTPTSDLAITAPDPNVTPIPVPGTMSNTCDTLQSTQSEHSPDATVTQEPPYLQLNIRIPCAKSDDVLANVGSAFLPFSYFYVPATGLAPTFSRLLRALIMEILHAPNVQFSYVAADYFAEELRSTEFFGRFQLSTGRNRPLRDVDALVAYFERTQAYFDRPHEGILDHKIIINVDIPDEITLASCDYEDSPYFVFLHAIRGGPGQSLGGIPVLSTFPTITSIPIPSSTDPSTPNKVTDTSPNIDTPAPSHVTPPSPATTQSIDYSHCSDATNADDTTPLGQLFVSSLRDLTTASCTRIAQGAAVAGGTLGTGLRRGMLGLQHRLRQPARPRPVPTMGPSSNFSSIRSSPHATSTTPPAQPTVTFHPTPTVVHIPSHDTDPVPTTPAPPTVAPPLTGTTASTTPSDYHSTFPDSMGNHHYAQGPDNTSGFTWRNRTVSPNWSSHAHGGVPRHTSSYSADRRDPHSSHPRGATYGTNTHSGTDPYSTHGTPPVRNMTPNYTMLGSTHMDMDNYLALLQRDVNLPYFTKQTNIPTHRPGEPIGMWYRRFVLHGASHGVYIAPYETLIPDTPLGYWFAQLPRELRVQIPSFVAAISAALNREGVFPDGSPEALTVATSPDGCHALYMLLRSTHPRLHGRGSSQQPEQGDNESFMAYMVRVRDYAYDELTLGHHLSDHALVGLALRNVHPRFRQPVNQHLDATYRKLDPGNDIPFALHIDQLAYTFQEAVTIYGAPHSCNTFHAPSTAQRPTSGTRSSSYGRHTDRQNGRIYNLSDDGDTPTFADFDANDVDDIVHRINTAQNRAPGACYLCHSTAHQANQCPDLVQAVHQQLVLSEHPHVRTQIMRQLRPDTHGRSDPTPWGSSPDFQRS